MKQNVADDSTSRGLTLSAHEAREFEVVNPSRQEAAR